MKAVVYKGFKDVAVEEVPDARIERPTDAVIRITTTNICGSDLHMYEGRAGVEEGKVLGHENMGIVEEVGPGVDRVKVGDRVSVPFNVACGTCRSCNAGWTSFCERVNPVDGMQGSAYGYANMGPYDGGRQSSCGFPTLTSTCSTRRRATSTRTTSRCSRTSFRPAGMVWCSRTSSRVTGWRCSVRARWV